MNHELQNIISGKSSAGSESIIHAAAHYLAESKTASGNAEPNELTKEQETAELKTFINQHQLWYTDFLDKEAK